MALAISPQFSINPAVTSFEPRWVGDSGRIDVGIERNAGHNFVAKAYVVYDPHGLDARHVELYRPHTEIVDVKLRNCGRPASDCMVDTGIPAAGRPRSVPRHIQYSGPGVPHRSCMPPLPHAAGTRRAKCDSRPRQARCPGDPSLLGQYASILAHTDRFDEILAIIEKARADGLINAQMRYCESEVHPLHGTLTKAIAVSEEALILDPEASVFVDRVRKLKALERPSKPPPPSVAPSLGARLRALLQKLLKLGTKKVWLLPPNSPRRVEIPPVASRRSRSPSRHRGAVRSGWSAAAERGQSGSGHAAIPTRSNDACRNRDGRLPW